MSGKKMPGIIEHNSSNLVDIYKISATSSNCGDILSLLILLISYNLINKKINSQHWINKLSKVQRLNVDGLLDFTNNLRYSLVPNKICRQDRVLYDGRSCLLKLSTLHIIFYWLYQYYFNYVLINT